MVLGVFGRVFRRTPIQPNLSTEVRPKWIWRGPLNNLQKVLRIKARSRKQNKTKPFQIPYQSPISDLSLVINRSKQYQKDQNFYALLYICLLLSSQVVGQISPQKNIAIGLLTIHMSWRTRHLILRGGWKRKANWSWPGPSRVIGHISLQKDIVLILILIFDFQ